MNKGTNSNRDKFMYWRWSNVHNACKLTYSQIKIRLLIATVVPNERTGRFTCLLQQCHQHVPAHEQHNYSAVPTYEHLIEG